MESIDIQCIGVHCIPVNTISRPGGGPGKMTKRVRWRFHYNSGNIRNHPEVKATPSCIACGAELEPPVRVPHTVYVKSLYRIAGQDYCRHHIIRAAVAAGVITEVKTGVGTGTVVIKSNGLPTAWALGLRARRENGVARGGLLTINVRHDIVQAV